jgi:glycosyltransferase involved in cell wall biosynthesis
MDDPRSNDPTVDSPAEGLAERVEQRLKELADLQDQERALNRETAAIRGSIAAIRASNSWRLVNRARQVRTRGRTFLAKTQWRLRHATRLLGGPVSRFVRTAPLGVNVAGYLTTESGMGEAARLSIRSIEAAGIPVALNHVDSFLRQHDTSVGGFVRENPHPVNLVHLNADNMAAFHARQGREYFRDRHTIGFWFWELSHFRDEWLDTFGYVDEVWVASEFGRRALLPQAPVPVVHMPLPIPAASAQAIDRRSLGVADRVTMFVFMFDVSSQFARKNPLGILRAFRRARLGSAHAALVLKFTNAEYDRAAVRRLKDEARGLPVVFLDGYMTRAELGGLLAASDCYVSLHRAEGFGLTMAEAMAAGRPVIATGYSGNLDFMSDRTSYLVRHRVVPLPRDFGPYPAGFEWADPDLDHAAELMQRVVEHPEDAAATGRRAAEAIASLRAPAVTGERVRARLEAIREGRIRSAS